MEDIIVKYLHMALLLFRNRTKDYADNFSIAGMFIDMSIDT